MTTERRSSPPARPRLTGRSAPILGAFLALQLGGDDAANLDRLRAVPPERRAQLSASLAAFDALPAAEQAAVRELDAKIAELPDEDQRREYLRVARRYHLWRRTLTDAERATLDAAAPEERVGLVNSLRAAQRSRATTTEQADWIQVSALNDLQLFAAAFLLRAWFDLDDAERVRVLASNDRIITFKELQAAGVRKKVIAKMRTVNQEYVAEIEGVPTTPEPAKAAAKSKAAKTIWKKVPRGVEWKFYKDHSRPAAVDPADLARFQAAIPPVILESLEPLPPDAAHQRLVVLYRIVFPKGSGEIPANATPVAKLAPKSPTPTPTPPAAGPSRPPGMVPL